MIMSFSKTPGAIEDESKTVTRRFWKPSHAAKFYVDMIVDAWTAGPHRDGKFIRKIRITKVPYLQDLRHMSDDHFEREGGVRYWATKSDYIDMMYLSAPKHLINDEAFMPFVVEFDYEVPE